LKQERRVRLQYLANRRAEWIWIKRNLPRSFFADTRQIPPEIPNRFCYFRRCFRLDVPADSAEALVSADGRYQLFLNGRLLGRGPARGSPDLQPFDRYDITPHVRKGQNCLALLVHAYGRHTSWYELPGPLHRRHFGSGGLFVQADLRCGGRLLAIDSDGEWRCREADAWRRDVPGGCLGFVEVYDAGAEPPGWRDPAFDDSSWEPAEVLRRPGENDSPDTIPFPVMIERMTPPPAESFEPGRRVLQGFAVRFADPGADGPDLFDEMKAEDHRKCRIENPDFCLDPERKAVINTTAGRGVCLVIDFGRIVTGRAGFSVETARAGALIDFACGEYLDRDGRVVLSAGVPGVNVPQVHRYRARAGVQRFERFEWEGFRYLQMVVHRADAPLALFGVGARVTVSPAEGRGRFDSSDPLLNRIWETGVRTLRACRQDSFMDCPTREQRQWMGDAYIEMMVSWAAFGDPRHAAQALYHIAGSQKRSGLTAPAAPGDFSRDDLVSIPDFALYWILGLEQYYLYTGDGEMAAQLFPAAERIVAWFERFAAADGLITDPPGWTFIDWAEVDKKGASTAVNAQYTGALRAMARLSAPARCREKQRFYMDLAGRTAAAVNRCLWDEDRGVYVDAVRNGRPGRRVSQQSNAAVIAFDVAPRERWDRLLNYILDEDRWVMTRCVSGPSVPVDEENQVVRLQPFYAHHLHRALDFAGRHPDLIRHIRQYWGPYNLEEDTLPELWRQTPASTTCHAWSATPTFDLSTSILGVRPLEPGFKTFLIRPNPLYLTCCEGIFPAPAGDIRVAWKLKDDDFHLSFDVPAGCTAALALPPWLGGEGDAARLGGIQDTQHKDKYSQLFSEGRHERIIRQVDPPGVIPADPVERPVPIVSLPDADAAEPAGVVARFTSRYAMAKAGGASYTFGLRISGQTWLLDIKQGKLSVKKRGGSADLVLSASAEVLHAVLTGRCEGSDAVAAGKIRFMGDLSRLPRFLELFGF
jgi:hypothetical protein